MPRDLPELRASYEDRDRVVDILRTAGGDGRLTAGELDARADRLDEPPARQAELSPGIQVMTRVVPVR